MIDALGVKHAQCEGTPRIACLVPSITELLFELDLSECVVARTGFCIHPQPQISRVPKVGGTKDVNIKKLLSLKPTYLIVNIDENRKEVIDEIKRLAPELHIVVTHPCAPTDNAGLFTLLGFIFRRESFAAALCARLDDALRSATAMTEALPRERVLYLIWKAPWMTVSADTYIARTLAHVGLMCAAPTENPVRYPTLLEHNPLWQEVDRVLLSSEPYAFRETHIKEIAHFAPQAAIHLIDGELTSWYGSRAIASMLALAQLRLAWAGRPAVTQWRRAAN